MEQKSPNKRVRDRTSHECKIYKKIVVGHKYKLNAHMFQHKAVPARFKCSFCPKEYYRSDVYHRHLNKHKGVKLKPKKFYICDHCDRAFVNKKNLILHLKVHDDGEDYNYTCVACGKSYCEERLLKYHVRKTHFNLQHSDNIQIIRDVNEKWIERVKESEVCVEMTQLKNNALTIKKYASIKKENEPEKIERNSGLERYMNSVLAEKEYTQYSKATCDYCHKEMLKKSLLSHIRERHLKLRKFGCEVCERTFARHYQLVDHDCGKQRRRRVKKTG